MGGGGGLPTHWVGGEGGGFKILREEGGVGGALRMRA